MSIKCLIYIIEKKKKNRIHEVKQLSYEDLNLDLSVEKS